VSVETPRGWRIAKEKASHKIDAAIALVMACVAAIGGRPTSIDVALLPGLAEVTAALRRPSPWGGMGPGDEGEDAVW
jgi:hypothetical protein